MSYLLRRLALLPVPLILVTIFVFLALRLSGDPVGIFLGVDATPEQVALLRDRLGLDEPLWWQFFDFVGGMLRGDFGESLQYGKPALEVVLSRLPATIQLALTSTGMALVGGILLGTLAAVRRGKLSDAMVAVFTAFAQSMPTFWLGIIFIQIFALNLGWLPTSGRTDWYSVILPALTLTVFLLPNFVLVVRVSLLEAMGETFVTSARARGASRFRALWRHAAPNALNALISMVGLQLGRMVAGAVVTEQVFAWPGIGLLTISAIGQRDLPIVMAGVMLVAVSIVIANLIVDILQSLVDPRIGGA